MKRLIIALVVFLLVCVDLKAQQSIELDSMQYLYCQLVGKGKFMSNKVTVIVDFGQINRVWSDQRLRDENGKVITFNSMVDAMNWMGVRGWEFVQAYVITIPSGVGGVQNVYHWLLKKSTEKMTLQEREELFKMFKTKKDFKNKDQEDNSVTYIDTDEVQDDDSSTNDYNSY